MCLVATEVKKLTMAAGPSKINELYTWEQTMITKLAGMAVVTAMLAASGPALATTFTYASYSVVNNQNVNISGPSPPPFITPDGSGQILLQGTSLGFDVPAWCIDIFDMLTPTGTYILGPS